MNSVERTNDGLKREFDNFKKKVETNERKYDSMYDDYNKLLLSYKDATGSILSLSQILATKGDKKDLDELKDYAYDLYKQVVLNHNTVMKELYGDDWSDGSGSATGDGTGSSAGNGNSTGTGSSSGSSNGKKSIRDEIGDLHEDVATETQERKEEAQGIRNDLSDETQAREDADQGIRDDLADETQARKEEAQGIRNDLADETAARKQDISDVRDELRDEADKTANEIKKMYEQIWGLEPGETVAKTDNSQLLKELDEKINSASKALAELQGESGSGDVSTGTTINSNSSSLQQAISNVISAYQTADNAIIDALKKESTNRRTSDEALQEQIDALVKAVSDNQNASQSDTLAIKKAIAPYVKDVNEHGAIPVKSYIYYDGKGLEGAGFYYVESGAAQNEDITGKVHRTSVAEAIQASNGKIGELIKLLQANEEFATRYKLK